MAKLRHNAVTLGRVTLLIYCCVTTAVVQHVNVTLMVCVYFCIVHSFE